MGPLLFSMARETVLWPLSAALAVTAAGFLLRKWIPLQISASLGIVAGFLTGYTLVYGVFSFPPIEAQGWLPYFIALNFAVFAVDDRVGFSRRIRLALQGLFSILGSVLIFVPLLKTGFSIGQLIVSIAIWFGLWGLLEGRNSPILFIVAAGNAVVSATTGSTMLGQFGGVLAAVLGAHLAFSLPKTRIPMGHAGTAVAVTILASLMLIGRTYADTALIPTLLILSAIPVDFAARWLLKHRANMSTLVGGALALIPVAIASIMAVKSYLAQQY